MQGFTWHKVTIIKTSRTSYKLCTIYNYCWIFRTYFKPLCCIIALIFLKFLDIIKKYFYIINYIWIQYITWIIEYVLHIEHLFKCLGDIIASTFLKGFDQSADLDIRIALLPIPPLAQHIWYCPAQVSGMTVL